jgi:hypothetical protein
MSRPSKLTSEAIDRFVKAISAGAFPEVAASFTPRFKARLQDRR